MSSIESRSESTEEIPEEHWTLFHAPNLPKSGGKDFYKKVYGGWVWGEPATSKTTPKRFRDFGRSLYRDDIPAVTLPPAVLGVSHPEAVFSVLLCSFIGTADLAEFSRARNDFYKCYQTSYLQKRWMSPSSVIEVMRGLARASGNAALLNCTGNLQYNQQYRRILVNFACCLIEFFDNAAITIGMFEGQDKLRIFANCDIPPDTPIFRSIDVENAIVRPITGQHNLPGSVNGRLHTPACYLSYRTQAPTITLGRYAHMTVFETFPPRAKPPSALVFHVSLFYALSINALTEGNLLTWNREGTVGTGGPPFDTAMPAGDWTQPAVTEEWNIPDPDAVAVED